MKDNGVICMHPWIGFTYTMKNTIRPCCRFPTSIDFGSQDRQEAFKDIRIKMLNGEEIPECKKCYEEEKVGDYSIRTGINTNPHPFATTLESADLTEDCLPLENIEFSLDNICNYECMMCDSRFSSKSYRRDEILHNHPDIRGMKPSKSANKNRLDLLKSQHQDLSQLNNIKLLGGEPFMSPSFIEFLEYLDSKSDLSKIRLEVVTNCSMPLSDKALYYMNQFGSIMLSASFDGIPLHHEYQRVNSNFEDNINNLFGYEEKLKPLEKIVIQQTFTTLNLNGFSDSFAWYRSYNSDWHIRWSYDEYTFSFLDAPDWYEEWILSELKDYDSETTLNNNKLKNIFKRRNYNPDNWKKQLKRIEVLDSYYGRKLENHNPSLAKRLKRIL